MVKRLGPISCIKLIRPHDEAVEHNASCPSHHGANAALHHCILMMSVGRREVEGLTFLSTIGLEILAAKWVIVSAEALDRNAHTFTELLK